MTSNYPFCVFHKTTDGDLAVRGFSATLAEAEAKAAGLRANVNGFTEWAVAASYPETATEIRDREARVSRIVALTPASVVSVYSGKAGKCCCGCSGSHRYNSANILLGADRRGYGVDKGEVNDSQVAKVIRLVKENAGIAEDGDGHISVERDGRLWVLYLV
jgi:hypothetical protein